MSKPSPAETEDWERQSRFLSSYLRICQEHWSFGPQWPCPQAGPPSKGGLRPRRAPESTPDAPPPKAQERPKEGHEWSSREGTRYCKVCLSVSRALHPPTTRCQGLALNMAQAVSRSKGHSILLAPRTDGTGIVIIWCHCGHYAASNRPTNLHKKDCQGFLSRPERQSHMRGSQKRCTPTLRGGARQGAGARLSRGVVGRPRAPRGH